MDEADYLPPLDSRALEVDVSYEVRRTLVDFIRGSAPTTVLGVLLTNMDGLALEDIAERLAKPVGLVGWNVEKLEEDDLCVCIVQGDVTKVMPFAAYTERNE